MSPVLTPSLSAMILPRDDPVFTRLQLAKAPTCH